MCDSTSSFILFSYIMIIFILTILTLSLIFNILYDLRNLWMTLRIHLSWYNPLSFVTFSYFFNLRFSEVNSSRFSFFQTFFNLNISFLFFFSFFYLTFLLLFLFAPVSVIHFPSYLNFSFDLKDFIRFVEETHWIYLKLRN